MEKLRHIYIAVVCCVIFLVDCSPSPSEQRGIKQGDIQVIAQWLEDGSPSFWGNLSWTFIMESRVSGACGPVCFVDGNDIGSGTRNLYIYAQPKDIDNTVSILVALERENRLPPNMKIGVAKYKDAKHSDWTYEPVFPKGLTHFDITYSQSGSASP